MALLTDCFLSIISPQRYQTGYHHLKQNWELAFWSLDTISSFGSLLISVPSPCNHTLKVASRPSVYTQQLKIAFIAVHQNHMLITWLITTLNCQPLLLTLPPFPSCLREEGDAAWITYTVGMPGPASVSHITSLIHYSLTCFLCSWKKCSVSVVTLVLCSAATFFWIPVCILCFAICSDDRLSKSMIACIIYTYMYYLCIVIFLGLVTCISYCTLYVLQIGLASVSIQNYSLAVLFSSFTAFLLGSNFYLLPTCTLLSGEKKKKKKALWQTFSFVCLL